MKLDTLIPPGDPVTRWRWLVAIAVTLLILNGLSGRGLIGIGTYAYANDVVVQGEKIDRILALQIAASLRQLNEELCRANGNKSILEQTIEKYQQEYREITRERYPLPSCEHR